MRFGVTTILTDESIGPHELAREAEARGFTSLFLPEHTHVPVSRRTPAPLGEPLPPEYRRMLDPFVALSAAASVTTALRVGTGCCLVAQRDPIITAKEVATLDHLSGGRFVFGVGFGWNVEEMAHHGVAYATRRAAVRERVLAMRRLWTLDEASFDGEHVRFEPSWSWPKPAQRPGPPVLLGGAGGPVLFRHIAEYADGWLPVGGRGVRAALPSLYAAFERAGRDPSSVRVVPLGSIPEPGKIEHFASLGITEAVLTLRGGGRDEVLRTLDGHAAIVAPYVSSGA